ncbi:MAG TPA: S53 family peptidase [Streptosporangiaceae bacterium]|nr:S53 family peptidase [Streptosporangiaceae bacterium]
MAVAAGPGTASAAGFPAPKPTVSDFQWLTGSQTPPTEANCFSVGRRCFTPTSMQNSYNLGPLHAAGKEGQGVTVAIIDSFGDPNIESDLNVFNNAMGLPHMCGEPGVTCASDMPTFQHEFWNGKTVVKAPPPGSNGAGSQTRNIWALETALDVEWVHSIAPKANILNVTTNPAETLGVQGFPQMMNAEQFIVDHHLATVISQSFAAAEETFASTQSLMNLRHAFVSAAANGVTVLGSSGDSGTANSTFTPVKNPGVFPFPTVEWPASDPLVTSVGGTYLCTNPVTGAGVDNTDPPVNCQGQPNREVGWVGSGGGFSHVFAKPSYQNTLPAGSTAIGSMRGVPDISYQASSRTGVLVYDTAPGDASGGLNCSPGNPCSAGWYVVGGTSASCPQWAALVAIAGQIAGHGLGLINPKLYSLATSPNYGSYFYDVTTGNNEQVGSGVPGFPATQGWDPVTGLGTPNAANLVPALAS